MATLATGQVAASTDSQALFADSLVRGPRGSPSLAVGGQAGHLEAEMAGTTGGKKTRNQWLVRSFWITGISLFLVEMSAGVDYVEASIAKQEVHGVDWLTSLGLMILKIVEQTVWHLGKLDHISRTLSLAALPFVLMAIGVAMSRRGTE